MKQFSKLFFIILLVFSLSIGNTMAQKKNYAPVVRGERPTIDLSKVSEDAYEKGIIKIKFDASYTKHLDNTNIGFDNKGNLIFGIAELDALNKKYQAKSVESVFMSDALKNEFTDRHRLWSLHLWYRLEFDENIDIKEIVAEYSKLKGIEIAEPEYKKELYDGVELKKAFDFKWTPNDTRYDEQWHYNNTGQSGGTADCDIDLPEAWDIEKGHEDVIVCIEDQGIQTDHPDIAANMWSGVGYNFVQGNSTINPGDHGCHVSGTVAGVNNNNTGISGVAGGDETNKGVSLMSCQVFDPSGAGFDQAPVWAADNGACISQNSWGYTTGGAYDQSTLDAIDYFNANGGGTQLNGGITIYAAGNSGTEDDWYPGCYSGCFAVAATNHDDEKSYYSNYGTWVNISAPGGETNSVSTEGVLSCFTSSSYGWYQGTSMACPHVSGVAALVISYAYRNGLVLSNSDVADILENSVDDHYAVNGSYTGKLGTGRLNAYQALLETQNYISGVLNPQSLTATAISKIQIDLDWTKNGDGNDVMLAWSTNSTFGTPNNGTSYSAGNSISGGGTVLYVGALTDFNHTGLTTGTTYYYRTWSFNGSTEYSSGRNANATTLKDAIFYDGFEDDEGWTFNGEWERDAPQGLGEDAYGDPDPSSAFNGSNVLGLDLTGNGDYQGNLTDHQETAISPIIDCSNYQDVELEFQRWLGVEQPTYDHAYLDISIDGGAWTELWTNSGTIDDGAWNEISFDVSAYADGQSSVQFRFSMGATDASWNYCGWNIDDFYVFGTSTSTVPVATVSSTSGCGTGSVFVISDMSGTQTFYLRDNSGDPLDEWTGDATSHEFTGLFDGIYRGQVDREDNMSELSDAVSLTNFTNPVAPSTVNATETSICIGSSTTLSYTGGLGDDFEWYTGSCGGTFINTGNDVSVNPITTTTYYGRWENVCGESTCKSVEIVVNDIVTATAGDDDNTCDDVYQLSANSVAGAIQYWAVTTGDASIADINDPDTEITITNSPVTLTWTISKNGCEDTDEVTITLGNTTSITTDPVDVEASIGDDVSFSVEAEGDNLTYQWKFEGTNIDGAEDATYQILSITMDDAGNYSVAINGDCGEAISENALLTVLTSIEELINFGINIYPNPSNGLINITYSEDISEMEVIITDVTGKLVHQEILNNNTATINLQQEAGIYLIRFNFNEKSVISTIIIE